MYLYVWGWDGIVGILSPFQVSHETQASPSSLHISVALHVLSLSLDLEVPVLSDLILHAAYLDPDELDDGKNDDVVIEHHTGDQDTETNQLQEEEVLPSYGHANRPDHKGPHRVQHHPSGSCQLFGHRDTGKVEECN